MRSNSKQSGFTIVELLIVIIIIGILAALIIIAYNGIIARANEASVKSDLRSAGNKIEVFFANHGYYPISTTDLVNAGIKVNKSAYLSAANNLLYCKDSVAGSSYALVGASSTSSKYSVSAQSKGVMAYSGTFPGASQTVVCPSFGLDSSGNLWGLNGGTWATWAGG